MSSFNMMQMLHSQIPRGLELKLLHITYNIFHEETKPVQKKKRKHQTADRVIHNHNILT